MIVLSLDKDEAMVVGERVVVRVIEIRGDEVDLAIEYPGGASVKLGETCPARHGPADREKAVAAACCH